jgi:undecaprenyl-diphosphatase
MPDRMNKPKFSRNEQLLTLVCAVFFAAFLFFTFFRGSFHSFDVEVNAWIPSIQSSSLTTINKGIAVAFDTTSLLILSVAIACYLFLKKSRAEGLFLLGAMGVDALVVSIVKGLIQSPRPLNELVFSSGFSFPSGHTAGSLVFCGYLAFFAWHRWQSTRARISTGIGVVAVSGVVGFSRVYLSVHWFSDVIGAGMLGVFLLAAAVLVFKLIQDRGNFESEGFRRISLPLFAVAVGVAVFIVLSSVIFGL